MFKIMDKKIFTIFSRNICLSKPVFIFFVSADSPKFRVTRSRIQSRSQQKALEILQESSQPVLVDRERLVHLLDSVVELTEGYTVSRLEKLHSIFSQSIYQHRLEFDKTQMIQVRPELFMIVLQRYTEQQKKRIF